MATSERRGSMSGKFEEIMAASKLSELLQKKDEDNTKKVLKKISMTILTTTSSMTKMK